MTAAERRKRVELALEAVGLTDRAGHYPRQLSDGQEQRVGIARAIVANPKVIVADEPTGSLDADTSQQIQILLQRLNREFSMTMVMVTHDPEVAKLATRQLRMVGGRLKIEHSVQRAVARHGSLNRSRSHCGYYSSHANSESRNR